VIPVPAGAGTAHPNVVVPDREHERDQRHMAPRPTCPGRRGPGNGRVYRIAFQGSDGKGGTCTGSVTVGVPHDQGKGKTPVDSGQTVNSFGP